MSENVGGSMFQPPSLPDFAERIDEKYICVKCKGFLNPPVKQTGCGHRLCNDCVTQINQSGDKRCPGKEEDCVPDISINMCPDFGTEREMKKMKVYCKNKTYGCNEITQWSKLQDHLLQCTFNPVDCRFAGLGCEEKVAMSRLEEHEASCGYQTLRCRHCGHNISKREMDQGHEDVCSQLPKECRFKSMGCNFNGSNEQLGVHLQEDHATHVEVLMASVAEMQLNDTRLRSQVQELTNENDMLKTKVEDCLKDNKKIKTQYDQKIKSLQKMTASNAEKVIELQKLEEPARLVTNLQDLSRIHESRITTLELKPLSGGGGGGIPGDASAKINSLEQSIGFHDVRLAEYDLRFQCLELGSHDGVLVWKIRDYSRRKQEALTGRTMSLYSQPFYTSRFGYKMCARVYLNGDGMGKGSHLSLFFVIMKGDYDALLPWPYRQKVTMSLMDQDGGRRNLTDTFRPDSTSTSFKRPTAEMNVASGCPLFATHEALERGSYLKDDTIFIKIAIDTSDLNHP